jgi:hypothetical protein
VLGSISGTAKDDVWFAGGRGGGLAHWDGKKIEVVPDKVTQPCLPVAVWAASREEVWVSCRESGRALHKRGETWELRKRELFTGEVFWGSSPTDIWAVGPGFGHWDGKRWHMTTPDLRGDTLRSISGSAAMNIWATGSRHLFHYDGKVWGPVTLDRDVHVSSVWVAGPADVWLVADGKVLRWDGTTWREVPTPVPVSVVAGIPAGNIWFGGPNGTVLHYQDGTVVAKPRMRSHASRLRRVLAAEGGLY